MSDIDKAVPPFVLEKDFSTATAVFKVRDWLTHVQISLRASSETHDGEVEQETTIRLDIEDWADVESLHAHLGRVLDNRKARVTALPTYEARFIDDPAFPTQRMSVTKWNNSLGGHDTLFIGTEAQVRERYEFFGNNTNRDIDNRPRYWVRDKI